MHKILKFLFISAALLVGVACVVAGGAWLVQQLAGLVAYINITYGTGAAAITIFCFLISPYVFGFAWFIVKENC